MKYSILILALLVSCQSYSQQQTPDFVIPITVTFDTSFPPSYLEIGLDSTATDSIDSHLGESSLPPIPPPGWEAVLVLPTSAPIWVLRDIRFGEVPYSGFKIHRLRVLSQYGATIHWNIPEGIFGLLEDTFGGILLSEIMVGQDSFYVPYTSLNDLNITIHYSGTVPIVQILNEIIVDDGIVPPRHLYFGLSEAATDSIDPLLGEADLPPFPPSNIFEAKFFLPENNFFGTLSSYSDFRYAILPYLGQKEWRIAYQTDYGNELTIFWDFPPYITGVLQDIINGTFINVPMVDSGSYTVTDPYVFNRLRMLIDFNITTPVELVMFNAIVSDENVQLNWTTATETNNSGFEIQRTSPRPSPYQGEGGEAGRGWESIGFVPGFGTTTETKSYSFVDDKVATGNYKYRLKQIDFDGTFEYSNEIEVEVDFTPKEFVLYQNYPNPFNPSTTIKYSLPVESNVRINIYNSLGEMIEELISETQPTGNYEVTWNAQNYSSGVYYYSFEVNSADGSQSHREMKKIVFLK